MMSKQSRHLNGAALIDGAFAGLIATLPMTAMMLILHRLLPWWERYALPPRQITEEVTRRVRGLKHTDEPTLELATVAAHFGFGAAAGALYPPVAKALPVPPVWDGIIYGLIVWTGSYLGWLPAARILPPATKQPMQRDILMIVAHLVWGSVLSWLVQRAGHNR